MKLFVFALVTLSIFMVCYGIPRPEDKYTDKFDNINLDDILANRRLLKNYIDCIMERGKCTADAQELKSRLSDAIQTQCSKCTDFQKNAGMKVKLHLLNNEREWWNELVNKYDPERKFSKKFEDDARKMGLIA